MKNLQLLLLAISIITVSCSDSLNEISTTDEVTNLVQIDTLPHQLLDGAETDALLLLREEEKLARDVYTGLFEKWTVLSFLNISKSEQNHMDAVLTLLNKYQIVDPAATTIAGEFKNTTLQYLYDSLVIAGSLTKEDGFLVGAAIEEIDILDLKTSLEITDNEDIQLVFQNLMKGSESHLRSFVKNLYSMGINYSPIYMTQEAYDLIIASGRQNGGASVGGKKNGNEI